MDLELRPSTAPCGETSPLGVLSELLGGVLNGEISLPSLRSNVSGSTNGVDGPEGVAADRLGFPARLMGGGAEGPDLGLRCSTGESIEA